MRAIQCTFPDSPGCAGHRYSSLTLILACLWVFHRREADTHHGFLWPSSSLPFSSLFTLTELSPLAAERASCEIPKCGLGRKGPWSLQPTSCCNVPQMCYQFPFSMPHPHTHLPTPAIKRQSHKREAHRLMHQHSSHTLVLLGLSPLPSPHTPHRIQKDFSSGGKYQVFGHMDEMWGCSWREGKRQVQKMLTKPQAVQICGLKTALVHPHTTTVSGLKPHTTNRAKKCRRNTLNHVFIF